MPVIRAEERQPETLLRYSQTLLRAEWLLSRAAEGFRDPVDASAARATRIGLQSVRAWIERSMEGER